MTEEHPYPHLAPREESEERAKKRAEILKMVLEAEKQGLYDVAEHYSGSVPLGLRMLDEAFQIGDRVKHIKTGNLGWVSNLRPETYEESMAAMENCGIETAETDIVKRGPENFLSYPGCLISWDDRYCEVAWVWKNEVEKIDD